MKQQIMCSITYFKHKTIIFAIREEHKVCHPLYVTEQRTTDFLYAPVMLFLLVTCWIESALKAI